MKGVILAGGNGTRLHPLTKVTNKHLLAVYDEPMIFYPLKKLINSGIKEILIVSGPGHAGHFVNLLGSGKEFGVRISYEIQDEAGGIAQALSLAENFVDDDNVCAILGDNIYEEDFDLSEFKTGAKIFLKEVNNAKRFGVADIDSDNKVLGIEEKPTNPKSNLAVTGLYVYDTSVFDIIKNLKPSNRGELEITDVNNEYIQRGEMDAQILKGFWSDAGTFESLFTSAEFIRKKQQSKH